MKVRTHGHVNMLKNLQIPQVQTGEMQLLIFSQVIVIITPPSDTCASGGWPASTTPTWTIHPWTSGWGYARQNHDSLLPGNTDKLEGTIILQDQENSKNQIQLHFYLTEYSDGSKDVNDNRECGSGIQYSETQVIPGGDWQYKGQPACVKVSNNL